jgi:hypothetical protein
MSEGINHDAAQIAADQGISNAADSANRASPGWIGEAAEALGWAATQLPGEFTVEQMRAICEALPDPPDLRAWGAATRMATRKGYIVKTERFATAASSNNSPKPLYRQGAWR